MNTARDLTNRLAELLRRERHAMADFLLALADFDRRRLWIELGHASLFAFLRRELGLSAGAAQYRKTAAELVQRHTEVEAALRAGKLCLSSVVELAKVVTAENVVEVLPRFHGLSSRDAAFVAASLRPVEAPPRRDVVTSVASVADSTTPARTVATGELPLDQVRAPELQPTQLGAGAAPSPAAAVRAPEVPRHPAAGVGANGPAAPPKPCTVEPLDGDRARLHITVSRRFLAKLDAARAALSHAKPGATSEEVLEACMDLLLAQRAKRNGLVARPRKTAEGVTASPAPESDAARPAQVAITAPSPAAVSPRHPSVAGSRSIPANVKREAWRRSGGRCEWPLDAGGSCGSTLRLELDHVVPRAQGGPSSIENVRVLCRFHNQLAARHAFGDDLVGRFARGRAATGVPQAGLPATSPTRDCS